MLRQVIIMMIKRNNTIKTLICALVIFAQIFAPAFVHAAATGARITDLDSVKSIYSSLQTANELNTGLNIEIYQSDVQTYQNDGKTLKISSALVPSLNEIDGGKGMKLFIAREIAYAENVRAGLTDVQLEYFSDKASFIVCKNANINASFATFHKVVKAITPDNSPNSDKVRTLKMGISQYVSPSDLAKMMSKKMAHGLTMKRSINSENIATVKGWQPILKSVAGGVAANIAARYGLSVASNVLEGNTVVKSLKNAAKSTFTSEFLVGGLAGSVIGGAVGTVVGSLIPVPGASPILAAFLSTAPALFGANLGSDVGTNMILDYKKNGKISMKRIWDSMDASYLIGHSAGMAAGMALGQAFIPIPVVGGMIGGIAGGFIGAKVASLFKLKKEDKRNPLNVNLPWLKKKPAAAPASEIKASSDESESSVQSPISKTAADSSQANTLNSQSQKDVQEKYQIYVRLLASEPEGSAALKKAFEDFKASSQKLMLIQESNGN